jgi:hypothetical protein
MQIIPVEYHPGFMAVINTVTICGCVTKDGVWIGYWIY